MSRRPDHPLRALTDLERQALLSISRSQSEPAAHVARAKELLAVSQGCSFSEAARRAGRKSGDAVAHLVVRFNENGLSALETQHGGGWQPTYGEAHRRRYDPRRPVVCMDEMSRQLLKEVRTPLEMEPGRPYRYNHHYERNGTMNLFTFFEPLRAWRAVMVRQRRTRLDWAECIRVLLGEHYAEAEKVVLVMDNLNTHEIASLYEAFAPAEARPLAERLEIHYTPKHGSWLNMAEIEQSVLARQALSRRIGDHEAMERITRAWYEERNAAEAAVDWQFTTDDARIKLKRLYPKIEH